MILRASAGLAGLVLLAITYGGGISLAIIVGRSAWGWLFLLIPGLIIAAVILTRIGIRLLTRALDG